MREYPRLGEAYALFDQCRFKQLVIREVPKEGGKAVEVRMAHVPQGYTVLPYTGGLLDQPAYLADVFAQFMFAERVVAMKLLTKS